MKKLYAGILMTGVLCSCALPAGAFEYISREAGFSVTIPDQNIMVVGENMFAAENRVFDMDKQAVKTNGMHMVTCLTPEQLKRNFSADFSTEKFNADLQNIKQSLKTTKNPLQSDAYKYLKQASAGAYVNYNGEAGDFGGLLQLNNQLGELAQIDKVAVENINGNAALMVEANINQMGFELKMPLKKSELIPDTPEDKAERDKMVEQGMKIEFSDDGYVVAKFDNLYRLKEKTYLLSANDNLYAVTSIYAAADSLPGMENLYKLDNKGFNKLNKALVKGLKFSAPQQAQALTINDNVSGRTLNLPEKWLYTRTDFSSIYDMEKGGFELTAYSALPETSLEKADEAVKTFGISFDDEAKTLKMDLSQFTMPDLLNLVDEGVVMASGNFNGVAQIKPEFQQYVDEYKLIFDMPEITKASFENAVQQVRYSLTPQDVTAIEKYLKAENFNYTFDINNYNGRLVCDANLHANIPDFFKVIQQASILAEQSATAEEAKDAFNSDAHFAMMNDNLVPFDCYFKNQLYFDRSQRFNNLFYFTRGDKATANAQIMKQFDTTDLYLY